MTFDTGVHNPQDRRQIKIFLTEKGRPLRDVLILCSFEGEQTKLAQLVGKL